MGVGVSEGEGMTRISLVAPNTRIRIKIVGKSQQSSRGPSPWSS